MLCLVFASTSVKNYTKGVKKLHFDQNKTEEKRLIV